LLERKRTIANIFTNANDYHLEVESFVIPRNGGIHADKESAA